MPFSPTNVNLQGRKIKRHKRVFKRQNEAVAPVGRDGLAREFGAEDSLADLEGVCQNAKDRLAHMWRVPACLTRTYTMS